MFTQFNTVLESLRVQVNSGQIIDTTFIPVPIERNNKEDNASIKQGNTPQEWSEKKRTHKDVDARWTKKSGVRHYGVEVAPISRTPYR